MMKWIVGMVLKLIYLAFRGSIPISFYKTTPDAEGKFHVTHYTPYFALDYFDKESSVLCRTFITLGPERLPAEHKKNYKKISKTLFKNSEQVFAVAETYFYNHSNNTVTVEPLSFTWEDVLSEPFIITDFQIPVASHAQAITPPLVRHVFYLEQEFTIEFLLLINSKEHLIKGKAKRLTPDDVKNMQGKQFISPE